MSETLDDMIDETLQDQMEVESTQEDKTLALLKNSHYSYSLFSTNFFFFFICPQNKANSYF